MTQLVTVQTDFTDLEQMAEGLIGRVHATHVILPAGDSVDEGAWAQFAISLQDGSSGLAGLGRCVTVVDNGSEREAHQRFDVVFDSLQFETHEQRVFEHILALHGAGGQQLEEVSDVDAESLPPQTAEDTGAFVEVSSDLSGPLSVPADAFEEDVTRVPSESDIPDERTMVASAEEFETYTDSVPSPGGEANDVVPHAAVHAPAQRSGVSNGGGGAAYAHGGAAVAHAVSTGLAPAVSTGLLEEALEEPLSGERIAQMTQQRPANGTAFAYTNGIPFPAKPPRPLLEPSLRVTPAPRPAGTSSH